MQNNTIAFTILKFPVLVRVQHNFTTVYSIFLRSPPKLGADILLFSLPRLSLLPPFNSLYVLKGTYVARLASWQIQTFSLVRFLRSKEPQCSSQEVSCLWVYNISQVLPSPKVQWSPRTQSVFCVIHAHNRNHFHQRNPFERRRAVAESSARRRRSERLSGLGPNWIERSSILWPGFVGSHGRFPCSSRGKCCWVWVVVRGVSCRWWWRYSPVAVLRSHLWGRWSPGLSCSSEE